MMKKTASFLALIFLLGHSSISAQEDNTLLKTVLIEADGFFDVKKTEFTFKKVDENRRIVAFDGSDFAFLQSFFNEQEGVIASSGHILDKTLEVSSLIGEDGQQMFNHCETVEDLNRLGYITIRLRSRIKSQYLIAIVPESVPEEMTAELLQESKPEDCNECGDVKVSKEALELLKNMDFGGEMFNFGTDSTSLKNKPSTTDMK